MTDNRNRKPARATGNRKYSVKNTKRRRTIAIILISVAVVLLAVGAWFYLRYHIYEDYVVTSEIDLTNSDERTKFLVCKRGYAHCAGDGITFFDRKGVLWAETYEMTQPLVDTCGSYIVVADLKGSDIYLYDMSGQINRISVSQPILDIEVSEQGVIAAATNDGVSNYIEVMDKEGNELISAKSVFASSGYLMDITLSDDGKSLAGAFIYVSEGTLQSRVVFYDFSGQGEITGGFNQYQDTVVTNVEFLNADTVCAVGDNALTFYNVAAVPSIIHEELNMPVEIQSLFFDRNRVGLIVEDESSENSYTIRVYDAGGNRLMNLGVDFAYTRASFAGNNVLLYSTNDCELYNYAGIRKYYGSFDEKIVDLVSCGNGRDFIYATANNTQFIRIK